MDFASIWLVVKGLLPVGAVGIIQYVLMALGALVVMGYTYVKVTPSQDDDAWFAKLEGVPVLGGFMKFVLSFSPVARKE